MADRVDILSSTVHNYLATLQAREYIVTVESEHHLADQFVHVGDDPLHASRTRRSPCHRTVSGRRTVYRERWESEGKHEHGT
ncbi:hypothetical protein DMJ13_23740 [halophilic archaeon]|nr:hypothetical protein DMJ13_23740 [halophilic archaeon]